MNQAIPLAERLRPQTLSELIGQEYLPNEIKGTAFYVPQKNAREEEIKIVFAGALERKVRLLV